MTEWPPWTRLLMFAFIVLSSFAPLNSAAQSPTTRSVSGCVTDAMVSHSPIRGVDRCQASP